MGGVTGIFSGMAEGFSLLRAAIGAVQDVKDLLPAGPKRDAVEKTLAQAARSSALAESQIAKSLGYPLHQCTFPPQIMLIDHVDASGEYPVDVYKCPACGAIDPPSAPRSPSSHRGSWMSG